MFSYEGGVLVGFLIWLYIAIMLPISINSTFERNLNRIGLRLSWLTLRPKIMNKEDSSRPPLKAVLKYVFIIGFGLPLVLLSWAYVAWALGAVVYARTKDAGAPQNVREYRWRLRNMDLTFDQLVKEQMKAADEDLQNFEDYRANIISDMQARGLQTPLV